MLAACITIVTLNPAIDRTLLVPGFQAGTTARVASSRLDPGGKGINVARVLQALGARVRVLGFLGENNGNLIARPLQQARIPAEFIPVPGDNRVNLKIIDPASHTLTEINDAGFTVEAAHLERLTARVRSALGASSVLVLAGSLPPGVPASIYRDLAGLAGAAGVQSIVDADGEALARALAARPTLIKPNLAEAEGLLGRPLRSRLEVTAAAGELLDRGARLAVISHGAAGAVLATPDGRWWATPPAITPGSTVGAGDSMVAGLALALSRGAPPAEALRLATAAGAATASLEGTQVCTRREVEALLPRVSVRPIANLEKEPDR